jgi:hypothetical protein
VAATHARGESPTQIKDLHAASKEEERYPLAEQTDQPRAEIDYPAAVGLCVFAFTHFGILLLSGYIAAQQADPGDTEEQRRNGFGMYTMLIVGMTLLALGSDAAALAWSRRRFRYLAPSVLIGVVQVRAVGYASVQDTISLPGLDGFEVIAVLAQPNPGLLGCNE